MKYCGMYLRKPGVSQSCGKPATWYLRVGSKRGTTNAANFFSCEEHIREYMRRIETNGYPLIEKYPIVQEN